MITSTFLPAAAPPLPPPLALDESPDVRPATTPTTTAIRAITATSDSENFSFGLLPDMLSPLPPSTGRSPLRERFLNGRQRTVRFWPCQENSHSDAEYITFRRV